MLYDSPSLAPPCATPSSSGLDYLGEMPSTANSTVLEPSLPSTTLPCRSITMTFVVAIKVAGF